MRIRLAVAMTVLMVMVSVVTVTRTVPASAEGTFTITPSTGLVDLETVMVEGSGYPADLLLAVCQGRSGVPLQAGGCGVFSEGGRTDASGAFSHPVRVRRMIESDVGLIDCTDPATSCQLTVFNFTFPFQPPVVSSVQPISFATPPPPPTTRGAVTVVPGSVVDRQTVTVAGAGFRPNTTINVVECPPAPTDTAFCDLLPALPDPPPGSPTTEALAIVTTDASGAFTTDLAVDKRFVNRQIGVRDCATGIPGTCVIAAGEAVDFAGTVSTAPLLFAEPINQPDAQIVRIYDGRVKGNDLYNLDGTHQSRTRLIAPGAKWSYRVRVQNDSKELAELVHLNGPAGTGPFTITYFHDFVDVTDTVTSPDGETFSQLQPGESTDLAVRFQVDPDAPPGASIDALLTFTADNGKADAVKVGVRVALP